MNDGLKLDSRRQTITELLARDGRVRVSALAEVLSVSEVTIRNDLAQLEREGLLERIPGGAVQTSGSYYDIDFMSRKRTNADLKAKMAEGVASLVADGETIMINSGTTTYFAATAISKLRGIKIVTNSIPVAMELGGLPNIRVILLGGAINTQFSFTYGDDTLTQLDQYRAATAILSVDGVSVKHGLTTYHSEEIAVNRRMMEHSGKTIVVADSVKLGRESFSYLCPTGQIRHLVTDGGADPRLVSELRAQGTDVLVCR